MPGQPRHLVQELNIGTLVLKVGYLSLLQLDIRDSQCKTTHGLPTSACTGIYGCRSAQVCHANKDMYLRVSAWDARPPAHSRGVASSGSQVECKFWLIKQPALLSTERVADTSSTSPRRRRELPRQAQASKSLHAESVRDRQERYSGVKGKLAVVRGEAE